MKVYEFVKRFLDVVLSLIVLIMLSPVMLVTSILILFTMGRPIFFVQRRPGRNGKIFLLYKFRTMTVGVNGKFVAADSDTDAARLTRLGLILRKTSLDELPEMFNILKGDMSFVGPRPLLEEYLPLYSQEQARRHEVRPGLTGLAQISGRNSLDWPDRLRLDVEYVKNRSIALDIKIFFRTIGVVISGHGVEANDSVTPKPFMGER